jgi:hypothetical protein
VKGFRGYMTSEAGLNKYRTYKGYYLGAEQGFQQLWEEIQFIMVAIEHPTTHSVSLNQQQALISRNW